MSQQRWFLLWLLSYLETYDKHWAFFDPSNLNIYQWAYLNLSKTSLVYCFGSMYIYMYLMIQLCCVPSIVALYRWLLGLGRVFCSYYICIQYQFYFIWLNLLIVPCLDCLLPLHPLLVVLTHGLAYLSWGINVCAIMAYMGRSWQIGIIALNSLVSSV